MKSGNLNFLEPSGPLQACNGTALPLFNCILWQTPTVFRKTRRAILLWICEHKYFSFRYENKNFTGSSRLWFLFIHDWSVFAVLENFASRQKYPSCLNAASQVDWPAPWWRLHLLSELNNTSRTIIILQAMYVRV